MLDASRNGVLKTEVIKRFIDRVKIMGYDTVGIYMEDVYEIDGEPYFGHLRGRYSKAELKEINAYAKAAGMNVLPCIQTLAHLHGMFRWRQYAAIRDTDDILLSTSLKRTRSSIKCSQPCANVSIAKRSISAWTKRGTWDSAHIKTNTALRTVSI